MEQNFSSIIQNVQVNLPFRMIEDDFGEKFFQHGLNPEIGIDATAIDRYSIREIQDGVQPFQDQGKRITVHGPFIDLAVGSTDPMVRAVCEERFSQLVDRAAIIRPVTVVCHTGYDERRHGFFKEEWIENSLPIWQKLAKRLADIGSRLMIENVYDQTPVMIRLILEEIRVSNPGFCMDTGHLNVFGTVPVTDWINEMKDWLGQIHFHDNNGQADQHLAPGKGTCDLKPVLSHIAANPDVIVTLEPHEEETLWETLGYLNYQIENGKALFL